MQSRKYLLLVVAVMLSISTCISAYVLERQPVPIKPEFYEPHVVIELFFTAVSRGELSIFGHIITKSALKPVRVEYVYELDSAVPKIKVYSELLSPIPVPDQQGYEVRGVSTIIDSEGSIVETAAHIWAK